MSVGPATWSGVTALCFVVIFRRVFCRNALTVDRSSSSSRQLVDQVVCLCLGDVISEGQSSLQGQRCVVSMD